MPQKSRYFKGGGGYPLPLSLVFLGNKKGVRVISRLFRHNKKGLGRLQSLPLLSWYRQRQRVRVRVRSCSRFSFLILLCCEILFRQRLQALSMPCLWVSREIQTKTRLPAIDRLLMLRYVRRGDRPLNNTLSCFMLLCALLPS